MLSLYRRHRPKTFDEVVGQDGVVRTLRNAIELDKVHHAYLFVGSRGTGKTSMAKLLACALNAEDGPRADFSPEDPACQEIMAGTSLDVVEMDAASNNSVDDIRQLRENVALAPMGGSRRVYTTTEAHKVPATIVDRCHRFDFGRPSLEQIAGVLRRVADEEKIEIPDAALGMIARKAGGSFRDALGTLEQLVTYGGPQVALGDVLENLGVADLDLIFDATEALVEKDPRAALLAVQRLADSGRDYEQFMRDLAAHIRHLLVTQISGQVPEAFSVTAEHAERLAAQAERITQAELLRSVDLLAAAIASVKEGSEPRLALEVALLKGTQPQADQSLAALMMRMDGLEARLEGQGAQSPQAPAPPAAAGEPSASVPAPDPEHSAPDRSPAGAAPARSVVAVSSEAGAGQAATAVAAVASVEAEAPAAPEPDSAADVDLEQIRSVWPAVADAVREQNAMVAALVAEAEPTALESGRLTLAFPTDAAFMKKKAEANRELVLGALRSLTGAALGVSFELSERSAGDGPGTLSTEELLERLKAEFGAREIFDGDEE